MNSFPDSTTLVWLLRLAGVCHLGLLCAGASMPRAVNLRAHLAALPPFIQRLYWVYFSFIALILVGFGTLTFVLAPQMAAGEPSARALCLLMAVFWSLRLVVAAFVFDVRPYLTHWVYRWGYRATNLVFAYFLAVYAVVLWKGGLS